MAIEVKLPELGEGIESGTVTGILVKPGDTVAEDDSIIEIETDKAVAEVPSSKAGTVKDILVVEGQELAVGKPILTLEEGGASEPPTGNDVPRPVATEKEALPPEPPTPAETPKLSGGPVDVQLPELGEGIESGTVTGILVQPGDEIAEDDSIIEIETDKAVAEVPSPSAGTVKEIRVEDGQDLKVGEVILVLEGGAAPAKKEAPTPVSKAQLVPAEETPEPEGEASTANVVEEKAELKDERKLPPPATKLVPAAPSVRRLAREIGVNITEVAGTGPSGRITPDDVKKHSKKLHEERAADGAARRGVPTEELPDFSKWGETTREAMSGVRRKTAEHLSFAWNEVPHVFQFDKADVTDLEAWREGKAGKAVERAGGKLTVTAILLKVIAEALRKYPQFNASVDMAKNEIIYKQYVNVGVAVDTDRGLLVPVIRDVDTKSITDLALELGKIAKKARDKKLTLDDMQGGNFTISNLGGIGGTNFTPVVNTPEVAILGVARASQEPVYVDGEFVPRTMMPLTLSYDHRIIDGADGARFLRWVCASLEDPMTIFL